MDVRRLADGLVTWSVERIQVDGVGRRRPASSMWSGPMFSIFPDATTWAAARWRPEPLTDAELDYYINTGHLPVEEE